MRKQTFRSVRTMQLLLNAVLALSERCVLLRFCAAGEVRCFLNLMFLSFLIMKDTRRGN